MATITNQFPYVWTKGAPINGVDSTSAAPTAGLFSGPGLGPPYQLAAVWKANDRSNRIFFSVSADGSTWPPGQPIDDVSTTSAAPSFSLSVLVWKSNDSSNVIFISFAQDLAFTPGYLPYILPAALSSTSAAPAVSYAVLPAGGNILLYVLFWKANDSSNRIISVIDPFPDVPQPITVQPINEVDSTSAAPAARAFQNRMYLFWKANDPSNLIYMTSSGDGQNWPPGQPLNGMDTTSDSPAACVFGDGLFLFWKANDPSNRIFFSVCHPLLETGPPRPVETATPVEALRHARERLRSFRRSAGCD